MDRYSHAETAAVAKALDVLPHLADKKVHPADKKVQPSDPAPVAPTAPAEGTDVSAFCLYGSQ
jgi:hypothetical protein